MDKEIVKELKSITKELSKIRKEFSKINKKEKEKLIFDTDIAIKFIQSKFEEEGLTEVTKEVVSKMLDYEEQYMRSLGIIEG